ncbi:hypothetical protein [Williamsia sp. 1135]|uniref:hypothetical protein n=1 Tax=Williamsia sp. 1135 TaxID=1889262 RepID=UPI000A0F7FA3|nr:hypothetical protein [Williamsia sp. 1135]ORM30111.1 hypothetical protein BFL43_18785 [Williamsia sp. 1135]
MSATDDSFSGTYEPPRRRQPDSPFIQRGRPSPGTIQDFWEWSTSDLLSNATRGVLAEFIVGLALGCVDDVRREWDAFDLVTPDGLRIEVKSAGYLQSWQQKSPSAISFGVSPATAWFAETNSYSEARRREADVYVFCVFNTTERRHANPLDLAQWLFLVAPTTDINVALGEQKTITLNSLRRRVKPSEVDYAGLPHAIRAASRDTQ